MSYGMAAGLQVAIYEALVADPALGALVGSAIYDVVPPGPVPGTYVTLGPEEARERADKSGGGAEHRFTVSIVTDAAGFQRAKDVAAAISDVLDGAEPPMGRGRIVWMRFQKARARRVRNGEMRRIDLTFRARVEDD